MDALYSFKVQFSPSISPCSDPAFCLNDPSQVQTGFGCSRFFCKRLQLPFELSFCSRHPLRQGTGRIKN